MNRFLIWFQTRGYCSPVAGMLMVSYVTEMTTIETTLKLYNTSVIKPVLLMCIVDTGIHSYWHHHIYNKTVSYHLLCVVICLCHITYICRIKLIILDNGIYSFFDENGFFMMIDTISYLVYYWLETGLTRASNTHIWARR